MTEINPNEVNAVDNETKIVNYNQEAKNGQTKCPKCGATDISLNTNSGKLKCNFCRYEFEAEKIANVEKDLNHLEGETIGKGAQNISSNTNDIITLKCSSCGAEIVIDTSLTTQARCHWCRNTLSINEQVPNGAVPDTVLPFHISKTEAKSDIERFVSKRRFYAHPKFKKEFTTDNIMGVYLPYMIIDSNSHAILKGKGEHETRHYTVKRGDRYETYYDADLYYIEREFDLTIEGLTIESSSDKLNRRAKDKTTNIINSIMPFDTENCVKWDANYIKGYTSEKRDMNIEDLKGTVLKQSKDISRFAANNSLKFYDRGVCWEKEEIIIKGQNWKSAYLPVWLYSYQQKKGDKSLLHYVAVNARTEETMGSIPVYKPKLFVISLLIEILGLILSIMLTILIDEDEGWTLIFLFSGFIYYAVIYSRYRNQNARHYHEKETKKNMTNLKKVDNLLKRQHGLSNSRMRNANNTEILS